MSSITDEERRKLVDALMLRQENIAAKGKALSAELRRIILKGEKSNDEEIQNLVRLLVYESVELFYSSRMYSYIDAGNTEIDDFKSELFILIAENLKEYNGINALTTFLDPFVKNAFSEAREVGRGLSSSRYYRDIGVSVVRAQNEMRKMGLANPTAVDIADFIRVRYNRVISELSIELWIMLHKHNAPIDESSPLVSADFNTPDEEVIKKEAHDEFYQCLSKLTPVNKKIIELELEYINNHTFKPTFSQLFPIMQKEGICSTDRDAENLIQNAHKELKRVVLAKEDKLEKKHVKPPLNYGEALQETPDYFEEDLEEVVASYMDE